MLPADLIDRFQLIPKLRLLHWQRVSLGGFGALAALSYNLWHKPVEPWLSLVGATVLGGVYLVAGAIALWVRMETCRRALEQPAANTREQVLRAAESLSRVGNAWLLWAAIGHALICIATFLRARLLVPPESIVLWFAVLPTIGQVAHGLCRAPTRERLLALVRLSERNDAAQA